MDKCRYQGKAVYAFAVYDKNNKINKEYEDLLSKASKQGKLICEYCGGKVRFNMGKKVAPYFSHQCEIQGHKCKNITDTEEHKKGRMILFQKLCEDYPKEFGEISYKFDDDIIGDVYFEFNDGKKLVLGYEDELLNLDTICSRKDFYYKRNISYKRFINCKIENINEICANSEMGYLYTLIDFNFEDVYVLDTERREVIMFSKMTNKDNAQGYNEVLFKRYSIDEVTISEDGEIICDFSDEINKLKLQQYELSLGKQNVVRKTQETINEEKEQIVEDESNKEQQLSLFDFL